MAEMENTNDGTWTGLKKTIVGVLGTVVTAGGVYVTTLFGGGNDSAPVQQAAPAPVININNTQQSAPSTTIIKERVVEKADSVKKVAPAKPKKEGDEFKEKPALW